jgi:hypothetical protein
MKKIAAILLFLFALVQAGPVICSLFSETNSVFVMDEEKSEENEKKEKIKLTALSSISGHFSHEINTALHLAEQIQPSPCLEKLTPPPNFC